MRVLIIVVFLLTAGCATSEKIGGWLAPPSQGGSGGGETVGSFFPEPWRTPATAALGLAGTLLMGNVVRKQKKVALVLAKGISKSGSKEARKATQIEARNAGVSGVVEELAATVSKIAGKAT